MKSISSRQNPIVRAYRELADEPDPSGLRLLLDGIHLVREAHAAGMRFESVVVRGPERSAPQRDQSAPHSDGAAVREAWTLAEHLERDGVDVISAVDRVFDAVSPVRTPSGIAAIVHRHPTTPLAILEQARLLALILVDVQDPGNVGSLLRVAEAGGITGVIVAGDSANPFSWKAVRGSMGSVLRLPVARAASFDAVIDDIRRTGTVAVAAVPRDGWDPDAVDWSGRIALLLGGEGPGLPDRVVSAANQRVSIPMEAPVESLNVATSAAIIIYAARRARTRS